MVGRTVIGSAPAEEVQYNSLPPEARALNRLFRLVKNRPEWIHESLLCALEELPPSRPQQYCLRHMRDTLQNVSVVENEKITAFAMESIVFRAFLPDDDEEEEKERGGGHQPQDNDDDDAHSKTPSMTNESAVASLAMVSDSSSAGAQTIQSNSSDESLPVLPTNNNNKPAKCSIQGKTSTILDDSSPSMTVPNKSNAVTVVSELSEEDDSSLIKTVDQKPAAHDSAVASSSSSMTPQEFWATILESMHLQIASRTTTVWGRKKIYEIYRLSGPAAAHKSLEDIRRGIDEEFRRIFCGGDEEHRVYATKRNNRIYCLLNIGKPFDYHDERNRSSSGAKKKKKSNEYIFWITPGSPLLAVTASRAPSNSRFTRFVLTAIDLVLSENANLNAPNNGPFVPERVGDWSGTEPAELLRAAHAAETGEAVGRFADYAENDTALCPLQDMQQAATACLLDRSREKTRLQMGAQHGQEVGNLVAGLPVVATTGPTGLVVVNHHQESRKRARADNLGSDRGGTAKLQRIRWKLLANTRAASACWQQQQDEKESTVRFKCQLSVQGSNIMEGLRAMMEAGLTQPNLPDFVRDAPSKGNATIVVKDGAIQNGPA